MGNSYIGIIIEKIHAKLSHKHDLFAFIEKFSKRSNMNESIKSWLFRVGCLSIQTTIRFFLFLIMISTRFMFFYLIYLDLCMSCNLVLLRYKEAHDLVQSLLVFLHVVSLLNRYWMEAFFFYFYSVRYSLKYQGASLFCNVFVIFLCLCLYCCIL